MKLVSLIVFQKSQAMKRLKEEGNTYFQNKNFEQALESYSQALEVDPDNAAFNSLLHYNKGLVKNSVRDWYLLSN
jgi:tetratricopeptide (TPR) repeat protein